MKIEAPASDLEEDLRRPDRYPPPEPTSVSLETTHLSWVFLTDTDAWKVKRPVDFGFADYSTLERRRHFCEEEVRLNRRLAPGVYLGVWPVRRDSRGFSLTGAGDVVDYAVRMRRLPRERSAEGLLEEGRLMPEHLDLLARTLSDFYERAGTLEQFGGADPLGRSLKENADQVESFVGDLIGIDEFRGLRDWHGAFLRRNRDRLDARVADGRIREGHGDLRLEHVYFMEDRARVIDCIDFNERFRYLDAASDAAFLAMELEHRRRPDLAGRFLGQFAAALNDFDFYPLLDFYLSTKAWVRAKVACFVAADPTTPSAKRDRKRMEARSLFTLATAFTRPPVRGPRLVAFGGPVASGKSTLADGLSRALGYPVVSSDSTRKYLAGVGALAEGGPELYAFDVTERVYDEILRRAERVLESGRSAILDATFGRRLHREKLRGLSRKTGAPLLFVETRCDPETARDRLRKRSLGPSVSDAREGFLERSLRDFEPARELPPEESMVADTEAAPARVLPGILDRIL
ncbi:MAG TPA: AAA family ATPase [Planctomycetota bacterium]|nr:AAA family ATPase [Planctomycetota bacterium]